MFKPAHGPLQLLNGPELEGRVDPWLKAGGMTRAACGHWVFTWNAFLIECDPQTVIETVDRFNLDAQEARDGAPYADPDALRPEPLTRQPPRPGAGAAPAATFTAILASDPDRIRRQRAEADVALSEITGEPVTLDAAQRSHAGETITGTITVTLETDATGAVQRRTRVTKVEIRGGPDGTQTLTTTETLVRRRAG